MTRQQKQVQTSQITSASHQYKNCLDYIHSASACVDTEAINIWTTDPEERGRVFESIYIAIARCYLDKHANGFVLKESILEAVGIVHAVNGAKWEQHRLWNGARHTGTGRHGRHGCHDDVDDRDERGPGGFPWYVVYTLLLVMHLNVPGVQQSVVNHVIASSPHQVQNICTALACGMENDTYYLDAMGYVYLPDTGMIPTKLEDLKGVLYVIQSLFVDRKVVQACNEAYQKAADLW